MYGLQNEQVQTKDSLEMADWKAYKSDEHEFEFQYPGDLQPYGCPLKSCIAFGHIRDAHNDNRIYSFTVFDYGSHVAQQNNGQEVIMAGQVANYEQEEQVFSLDTGYTVDNITKIYSLEKNGKTYQINVQFDKNNHQDEVLAEKMLSTFKFTR